MLLLVASRPDAASMGQREALLRVPGWTEHGRLGDAPILRRDDLALVTIPDLHLYRDGIDREAQIALGEAPEAVVFLSKHRSESGTPSLTVHPIGNLGSADLGGRPRTLVPADPHRMTDTLRAIRREAAGTGYAVTFEATHHGPHLETPAFFIEAGSTETEWSDPRAAEILMRALLSVRARDGPVAVGVGGGHYTPRLTDLALRRDVALAHLVPGYDLPQLDDEMLDQIIARSRGASLVYFHRKAIEKPVLRDLERRFEARGLRAVREDDLDPLPGSQSY